MFCVYSVPKYVLICDIYGPPETAPEDLCYYVRSDRENGVISIKISFKCSNGINTSPNSFVKRNKELSPRKQERRDPACSSLQIVPYQDVAASLSDYVAERVIKEKCTL